MMTFSLFKNSKIYLLEHISPKIMISMMHMKKIFNKILIPIKVLNQIKIYIIMMMMIINNSNNKKMINKILFLNSQEKENFHKSNFNNKHLLA